MVDPRKIDRLTIRRSSCPLVQWDFWETNADRFAAFAAERLGTALAAEVGQISVQGAVTIVKTAPRRFWIFAPEPRDLPLGVPADLGTELDLSEGRVRIEVQSPELRDVVAQCLAIDWEETLNRATFAQMHRIPVMFTRRSAEEGEFVVPRTFAQSIAEWLEDCL